MTGEEEEIDQLQAKVKGLEAKLDTVASAQDENSEEEIEARINDVSICSLLSVLSC